MQANEVMAQLDFERQFEAQEQAYFAAAMIDCRQLSARLSLKQCELNRQTIISCAKCTQDRTPMAAVISAVAGDSGAREVLQMAANPAFQDWVAKVDVKNRDRGPGTSKIAPIVSEIPPIVQEAAEHVGAALAAPISKEQPVSPANEERKDMGKTGDCPTCGRTGVCMQSPKKCSRCYYRIRQGQDPITGKPVSQAAVKKAVAPLLTADVISALVNLGYSKTTAKGVLDKVKVPENATVESLLRVCLGYLKKPEAALPPLQRPCPIHRLLRSYRPQSRLPNRRI